MLTVETIGRRPREYLINLGGFPYHHRPRDVEGYNGLRKLWDTLHELVAQDYLSILLLAIQQ